MVKLHTHGPLQCLLRLDLGLETGVVCCVCVLSLSKEPRPRGLGYRSAWSIVSLSRRVVSVRVFGFHGPQCNST